MNARIVLILLFLIIPCSIVLASQSEPVPLTYLNTDYSDKTIPLLLNDLILHIPRQDSSNLDYTNLSKATCFEFNETFNTIGEISTKSYLYYQPNGSRQITFAKRASVYDYKLSAVGIGDLTTFTLGQASEFNLKPDLNLSYSNLNSYYVDSANGDDSNDGMSSQSAFATIQHAIDIVPEGSEILIKPGIYTNQIDFYGKAVTIRGLAEPAGVPVLEVPGDYAVVFANKEGPDSILKNVVIRNSNTAILITHSSPTICNVTIVNNMYGIEAYANSNPDISNCIFWNNREDDLLGCEANYSWIQSQLTADTFPLQLYLPGLVHYWPFDEGQDNILNDIISDKNGDISGAVWSQGISGTALSFDGEEDYVALPDNEPVWLPQNDFTISFWVYFGSSPDYQAAEVLLDLDSAGSSNPDNELGINIQLYGQYDPKLFHFEITTITDTDEGLDADMIIISNKWYHVTFERNGKKQVMYIDGQLNAMRDCSSDPIKFYGGYNNDQVNIGRYTTNVGEPRCYFKGKLDELMIFNRALTDHEIMQIYETQLNEGILNNPMFVDPDNSDYHLKSQRGRYWPEHDVWVLDDVTSPCIDAGDSMDDPSDEPMPNGGFINMGAYGGTAYASMSEMPFPEPDYNKDGVIDASDLAELIEQWLAVSGF